jgi:probable rRNA maturation factor
VISNPQTTERIDHRALSRFAAEARDTIGLRGHLSVRITSTRKMQELNRRFRRKNKPTDVLSFPSGMPQVAGDIAIAREMAAANACELGHSITTELKILIVHGLLHLAGYDHESDNGDMSARESELRQQFGLPTGLIERTQAGTASDARKKSIVKTARLQLRPSEAPRQTRGSRRA